ncbi:ras-related protein Rab-34-like isoform X2 [Dysidea avara]|uniref:ras-related protein Rab-34-like isoform X2 n=1 Tax=Dysidea avara TaxID=196820 RepID=UPI003324DEEA
MSLTRDEEEDIIQYPAAFCESLSLFPGRIDYSLSTKKGCAAGIGYLSIRTAKIIILGEAAVGKTSLVNRYFHNMFETGYKATIGVDFMCQQYKILGIPIKVQVWDTAGAERFRSLTYTYFRKAHAILLVFDMHDTSSLQKLRDWHQDALKHCGRPFETFVIGSKLDLCQSEYDRRPAHTVSSSLGAEYWETSSKTGENVDDLFTRVAAVVFERIMEAESSEQEEKQATIGPSNTLIIEEKVSTKKTKRKGFSFC